MKHRVFASILATAALITLPACTSQSSDPASTRNPWQDEIDRSVELAKDPLTKDILRDGRITDEESQEAFNAFAKCAKDQGVTISATYRNGLIVGYSAPSGNDQIIDSCAEGGYMLISALYGDMKRNPLNEDFNEVLARCLRANGLAPGVTKEQLDQSSKTGKYDFDLADPRYEECVS